MNRLSKDFCILWILRLCFLYASSSSSISPIALYLSRTAKAPS